MYSAHVGMFGVQHIVCTMHMVGSILWANGVHMCVYICILYVLAELEGSVNIVVHIVCKI